MSTDPNSIQALNDQLRTTGKGGSVVITPGIEAFDDVKRAAVMTAVQTFDRFTTDNDPDGEHDCAIVQVEGERIMFKIDYYDCSMRFRSPDAADAKLTRRVLTIMLASEY
jgi:hypothetical protein